MAGRLELNDGLSRVTLAPHEGGGVATFHALTPGGELPVLKPREGAGALGLGMNLLAPFSNRISGGGFVHEGRFHAVAPNLSGEPFPIHGDAFQKPWRVEEEGPGHARLRLAEGAIGPWRYEATVTYALERGTLAARLTMTNRGEALPFGGGFHPWFPRRAGTRARFAAEAVWTEDGRHLPVERLAVEAGGAWDFRAERALPEGFVNNAFEGWPGEATLGPVAPGLAVTMAAAPPLGVVILYSPGATAGFVCLEPVSHPVDAHNLPGRPGLVTLAPGESLTLVVRIGWTAGASAAGENRAG